MASSHVVMGHLFARGVIEPLYFFGWGFTWVYLSRDLMVAVMDEADVRLVVCPEAMVLHAEWLRAFLGVFEQTQDRFHVWVAWHQENIQ